MRTFLSKARFFVLLVPLLQLGVRTAHAAEPEVTTWQTLFERCQKLSNEGDYTGALKNCQQAYALHADPGIQAYIAQIHTVLLHPVQALEALEKYLESREITDAERKTADAQRRYLETLIARLTITTPLEGAEIRVDDQVVDTGALAKGVRVPAGAHRVELKAPGATYSRFIVLRGGESTQLELPGNGTIVLSCGVPDTRFFIDGQEVEASEVARGIARPAGRHRVAFKPGSTTSPEQEVMVTPQERVTVVCTPSHEAPSMNPRGYWVTGTGLALGVAALTTAIYNGTQYNRWETANDDLRNDLKDNTVTLVDAAHRAQENDQLMDSIKTGRKIAVGLGVTSALVTTGGILLLFADAKTPTNAGSNSWFRKVASAVTVSSAVNSGEIAWRGAW